MALFLPDANVLIHALRAESPDHARCRRWLLEVSTAGDLIGLAESVEIALLRIPTLPKLDLVPVAEVLGFWNDDLLVYPGTRRLMAGARHAEILCRLVREQGLCGNDMNDVWLAALAMEQRATLVSTDRGFGRFTGLDWLDPQHGNS